MVFILVAVRGIYLPGSMVSRGSSNLFSWYYLYFCRFWYSSHLELVLNRCALDVQEPVRHQRYPETGICCMHMD